jgi:hypothetical protein
MVPNFNVLPLQAEDVDIFVLSKTCISEFKEQDLPAAEHSVDSTQSSEIISLAQRQ